MSRHATKQASIAKWKLYVCITVYYSMINILFLCIKAKLHPTSIVLLISADMLIKQNKNSMAIFFMFNMIDILVIHVRGFSQDVLLINTQNM